MKYIGIVFAFVAMLFLVLPEDADARRMGGGKSFGGKSSFSKPAAKPPVSPGINNNAGAGAAGAGAAATTMNRGGMGMGLMGGLLAGTLIGSMLMGTPFAGGGLLDFLIIGLLAYLAFRLFSGFMGGRQGGSQGGRAQPQTQAQRSYAQAQAREEYVHEDTSSKISSIDNAEFIEGAKTAFNRLQSSWAKRDLSDIKIFTTSAVYNEIEKHAKEEPDPSTVEIMSLNAQINIIEKENKADRISVYFTCLIREGDEENAKNITELWHFLREDEYSMWKVDGIQQV